MKDNPKILHGRDGDWIQCSYEEYENNYTNKERYAFIVDQDSNRGDYYKKVILESLENQSEIKNERMEDWLVFDFCLCEYSDCPQSMICSRFLYKGYANPVYIKFKNICDQSNDFQWFYGDRRKLIKPEFIEENLGDTSEWRNCKEN